MKDTIRTLIAKFKTLMSTGGSLTKQSLSSGVWMGATNAIARVLQLLMVLVLARMLDPADFGLMGVALLAMGAMNRFVKLGIDSALIYNAKEDVDAYLNTAWMLRIARGLFIAVVIVGMAPLLARLFDSPQVAAVLPIMAIGPVLEGFRNPGIVYFRKHLNYDKRFAYEVSASSVQLVVAIAYALVSPTVWALVAGYLSTSAVKFLGSYVLHGYRPWPSFDLDNAKEIVDYGKWLLFSSAVNFVHDNGDDAFVAWLLSTTALGYYQMAFRFSNAPVTEVSHVITNVAFPTYSKLQDDIAALRTGFFRVVRLATFVATPMSIGIVAIAPTFVEAFMGEQWMPMVLPMQILGLYAVWRAFGSTFGEVWKAVGRPDYLAKLQTLGTALIFLFIYPATMRWGIAGTAFVIFGTYMFIMMPIDVWVTVRTLNTSMWSLFGVITYPLLASGFMAMAVFGVRQSLPFDMPIVEFFVLMVVGAVSYVVAVGVLEFKFDWGLRSELNAIRQAV